MASSKVDCHLLDHLQLDWTKEVLRIPPLLYTLLALLLRPQGSPRSLQQSSQCKRERSRRCWIGATQDARRRQIRYGYPKSSAAAGLLFCHAGRAVRLDDRLQRSVPTFLPIQRRQAASRAVGIFIFLAIGWI